MNKPKPKTAAGRNALKLERQYKALKFRQADLSYREIAKKIGVSSTVAYEYVKDIMDAMRAETREACIMIRELEVNRIDKALKAINKKTNKGEVAAINVMLKLQERKARFLGLDMPKKSEVSIDIPDPIMFVLADNERS